MLFDGCFYEVDGLVALGAFPALVLGADEVLVDPAVAFVSGVDELAAAGAAADRALEVMLVLAVALTGVPVGNEHGLDLVEQLLADERLMAALVDMALVGDVPGVVRAAQQFVHTRERQRLWPEAPCRPRAQTTGLQQHGDVRQAVEPGGVGLECPYDDWAALGVDGDRAYLAAVWQRLADVQVADRCEAGCAANLDLAFDVPRLTSSEISMRRAAAAAAITPSSRMPCEDSSPIGSLTETSFALDPSGSAAVASPAPTSP